MVKLFYVWLILLPCLTAAQGSFNMTLLSNWDLPNLPERFGAEYNDCWGFRHANGTEVAIIGGIEDIFFVNITSPANPVLIHTHHVTNISGTTNESLWRDFKSYQNFVYAASDEGDAGLLVFNLSNVPNSVTMVYQTNSFWSRAHNIFVDEQNARLYAAGSNTQSNGLKVLSLATPANPSLLGSVSLVPFGGGYVHDVYVRDDTAFCSHGSLSKLSIYDVSDLSNITVVGVIDNYPDEGYNHSSWLNAAGNMLVMADETQGSDLKLIDVSDPLNISPDDINTFYSELEGAGAPGASIAHNPFIKGDLAYISYYHDGVQVFDISDPENIELFAYYDTHENTGYSGYDGCWGVYPFFQSEVIIGSDQLNGLFVLEITSGALPLSFLAFDARPEGGKVSLSWDVADASFGNEFEVKRSIDNGITFETIGIVALVNNESHYEFTDDRVQANRKYHYRIDFVELDGNRVKSPLRSVLSGQSPTILHLVNPVTTSLIIDLLSPVEALDLKLYDMYGRLVWSHAEEDPRARMTLPVLDLIPGHYMLHAYWPEGSESMILQKSPYN